MGGVSMEWKEDVLGNVLEVKYGKDHKKLADGQYPVYGSGGLMRYVDSKLYDGPSILIPRKGTLSNIMFVDNPFWTVDTMFWSIINTDKVDPKFLFYSICKRDFASMNVGSAVPSMTVNILNDIQISYPKNIEDQRRIASILSSLDRKIELNNKINADLEEMAQAIFKNWFVDFEPFKDGKFVDSELGMIPEGWKVGRADDFYQINIGKTPPRKEHKWFSNNPADKIWVSIANMGNSGIFISDSSEYLTKEAVDRHNIIMVPRNTILLSFKLTVGRVAIADKELTTNEAIARFILSDDKYMEYLYLYLKKYDYNSLGSTSSIATAVNSKTIKGMQMLQPSDKIIDAFHIQVNPIFEKIRSLTKESSRLSLLRDTLLPRLMSGELEVPE